MNIIDRVKAHFESKGVKTIEVSEWGEEGKPLVIYAQPMTLAEIMIEQEVVMRKILKS